ncbi:MAG: PorP/SprF family type IX secretion system membrane protein [Bacteroidales bacterium]|jgi:type IX secretion system PorP/SprF family membrane protein|nr:PorP/SprF family type IX secretion system membrane protein [Bacteroidales bacterium]
MIKNYLKFLLTGIALVLLSTAAITQQMPFSSHYIFNRYTLDPAFAGAYDQAAVYLNYRRDWGNIEGSPQTFRANGFGNVYKNMYLGGEIIADNTDIYNRLKANISYTYRLPMTNEQNLSFSVSGNLYQSVIRFDKVNADLNDPLLKDISRITGTNFNAAFGLVYNWRDLHIGIGMPVLFRTQNPYQIKADGKFAFDRAFLLHASNRFYLDDRWQLQLFGVFQKTDNMPSVVDISATVFYDNKYHFGLLYRSGGALAFGFGGQLIDNFMLAYSYEFGLAGLYNGSGGAHEITVGYRIPALNRNQTNKSVINQNKRPSAPLRPIGNSPKPVEFNRR